MPNDLATLAQQARAASLQAYTPYSGFKVGAALIDDLGQTHTGCNVEAVNLKGGNCAEGGAIHGMIKSGGRVIRDIVVIGPAGKNAASPCGNCRQLIREFADDRTRIHIADPESLAILRSLSMNELLPDSFGPGAL